MAITFDDATNITVDGLDFWLLFQAQIFLYFLEGMRYT